MKKLSSKNTFTLKKLFPLFWFGFHIIILFEGLFGNIKGIGHRIIFIVFAIGMMVLGYFLIKKFVWNLIDEVYDCGSALLFRNKGIEFRVNFKDIKNVKYTRIFTPPRVTLSIRYETEFGDELSFSPPASWIPNNDIMLLIDRIDKAQG